MKAHRIIVACLGALVSVLVASAVSADTLYIRNPLDTPSQITSDWNHQSGEKSLDLVYDESRTTVDAPVIWRLDNVSATLTVYYEVSEYSGGCDGQTYRVYTVSGGIYTTRGYVHYVHMYGYSTGQSANVYASNSEAYTVGWLSSTDANCTFTGPHLHHGKTDGGNLNHASWLNSGIGSGDNYDVTSGDITIYY